MINEQREAIKILKEIQESNRAWLMQTKEENCEKIYLKDIEAIDTVLSLIKEQQEEIEKKDKQINLMAEFIGQDMMCIRPEIECNKMTHDCKECIKQYFERKVEDVKD